MAAEQLDYYVIEECKQIMLFLSINNNNADTNKFVKKKKSSQYCILSGVRMPPMIKDEQILEARCSDGSLDVNKMKVLCNKYLLLILAFFEK